jgi:hypothetical protein
VSTDPLEQFRRTPAKSATADSGDYEAFKAVDRRQLRLHVRPSGASWNRLPYSYLLRIVEDGPYGTELVLVYTFAVVVILGRNLQQIAEAIADERCVFVEEWDTERREKPKDDSEPFIESIKVHTQKPSADVLAELENAD